MKLIIENETNDKLFIKDFISFTDARHWIVAHLDLSLKWFVTQIA